MPETTHTLDELVALYSRSAFIVWISLLSSAIVAVLTTAHVAEWQLERRLHKASGGAPSTTGNSWRKQGRKASGSGMLDVEETVEERSPLLPKYGEETSTAINALPLLVSRNSAKVDAARRQSPPSLEVGTERDVKAPATLSAEAIERTKLYLGVAFGVASGTLSGLCLLFAKTGVELLILTIVGQNQVRPPRPFEILQLTGPVWTNPGLAHHTAPPLHGAAAAVLPQPCAPSVWTDAHLPPRLLLLQPLLDHLGVDLLRPVEHALGAAVWHGRSGDRRAAHWRVGGESQGGAGLRRGRRGGGDGGTVDRGAGGAGGAQSSG